MTRGARPQPRLAALACAAVLAAASPPARAQDADASTSTSADASAPPTTGAPATAATEPPASAGTGSSSAAQGEGRASGTPSPNAAPASATTSSARPASAESASAQAPGGVAQPRRRRARRRRGLARSRGPLLSIGWRYTSIPTEGQGGETHAVQLTFQPFARERTLFRAVIGAEIALRDGPADHIDAIAWLVTGVGVHLPGRLITPYASAVFYGGFGTRSRFLQTVAEGAWMLGGEIGADLRIAGFFGLGLALGVGRTVIGEQYSVAAWLRASVALF